MKRLLLLSCLFLLTALGAKAQTSFTVDGIRYSTLDETTCEVLGSNTEGDIVIPSAVTYEDVEYRVTSIGDYAFYGYSSLTSVVMPEGVTSIGDEAFRDCSSLTSLIIPDGVTSIGDQAFRDCSSLTSLIIPDGVTSIGDQAFYSCSSLTSVVIPESVANIGSSIFADCHALESIDVAEGNTTYDSRNNCNAIVETQSNTLIVGCKNTVIPDGVTSIGNSAFSGCSSLTSIVIPDGVTSIGRYTFYGCSSLTSIVIPEGVTSIGESTFRGCSSLTSIVIPEGVTVIEYYTFFGCSSLTSIVIPEGVTSIGNSAFSSCSSFTSVAIPESVTSIGNSAFSGCSSLTSVVIPEGVTSIGGLAFYGCSSLTSVVIPEGVTSIGLYTFNGCSSLTSVVIPEGVTSIGTGAFGEVKSVIFKSATVPTFGSNTIGADNVYVPASALEDYRTALSGPGSNTIKAIGDGTIIAPGKYKIDVTAGESCSGITTVLAVLGVTDMTTVTDLTVSGSINSYDFEVMREQMTNLVNLDLGNANVVANSYAPNVFSDKYAYTENDKLPTCAFYAHTSLKTVVMPSSITSIGQRAFDDCSSLTSIDIPASVTRIELFAFHGCSSITSAFIPEGVTYISSGIFAGCDALESIDVADGNTVYDSRDNCNAIITTHTDTLVMGCKNTVISESVTSIGYEAFREFSSLTSIDIPTSVTSIGDKAFLGCSSLASIVIPEGVTNIGYVTFRECSSLAYVDIPESVTSIEDKAFLDCSSLTSIVIPAGVTSIGASVFPRLKSITFEPLEVPAIPYNYISADTVYVHASVLDAYRSALSSLNPNRIKPIEGEMVAPGKYIINVTAEKSGSGVATVLADLGVTDMTMVTDLTVNGSINSYDFEVMREQMTKLVNLDLSNTDATHIPSQAFADHKVLESVVLPLTTTNIYSYAFQNCPSLTSIVIPDSVTNIGDRAFYRCTSLPSISLPTNVMAIGNYAFYECSSLGSIVIPDSVRHIGNYAFYECSSISFVVIPDSIKQIGSYAFSGCSSLSSIVVPASISNIENYAFRDVDMVTIKAETVPTFGGTSLGCNSIFVPRKALAEYRTALSDHPTSSIMAIEDTHEFEVEVVAVEDASGLMAALAPFGLSEADNSLWNVLELKVSGTINSRDFMIMRNKMINMRKLDLSEATIVYNAYEHYSGYHSENNILPAYAFSHSNLVECKLPVNIIGMGVHAFDNCSQLKTIDIPDGVTSIPEQAFYYCRELKSIKLPENLVSIGGFAFYYTGLTDIKLPTGLKTIAYYALNGSKLTEVHLPSSITSVGDYAFSTSTLKDVYTYIVEPLNIGQETFHSDTYANATLHIQETAYKNYYYDTQWSQFQKLAEFDEPYEYFYLNKDFTIDAETPRLDGVEDEETGEVTPPDADMNPGSGLIVKGDESQDMGDVHLGSDGEGNSGSLVGEGTQNGNCNININRLHVDINVKAGRWYFFAFPFDVPLTNITYDGSSAWRYYDGAHRAEHGSGGWKNVKGDKLEAWKGYIFQGSITDTLTIAFDKVKVDSEDRDVPLKEHKADDDHNASWNFVGNPHFNYFDINDLDYDQPITVWNGSSYETYRKGDDDRVLHPFEGYFVQKPDNKDGMHYDADHRQTKRQSDARKTALAPQRAAARVANKERKLINLTLSDGQTTDRTRIVFNERSREAYEKACDAAKFLASGVPQIYSVDADNVNYSINERPEGNGIVALGYVANAKGEYTISVARADVSVMLYDKVADKVHYFTNGGYSFTSEAGTFNDRFQIIKTGDNGGATAINGVCTAGDAVIDTVEGKLLISNADGLNTTVTAINGTAIGTIAGNGSLKVQPGIYVVTIGSHSQKVMLK